MTEANKMTEANRIRKRFRLAGLGIALLLGMSACGAAKPTELSNAGESGDPGREAVSGQTGQDPDGQMADGANKSGQQTDAQEQLMGNGSCFVKKGGRVFFAAGATLCCYDEAEGKLTEIAECEKNEYDDSDITLYYCDGWFYYDHYDAELENNRVYRVNEKTGEQEAVCQGYLEGVSGDSRHLFVTDYESGNAIVMVYEGDQLMGRLKSEGNSDAYYSGTDGDYLFACYSNYEKETPDYRILAAKISNPEKWMVLGQMPCLNEDGNWYEYPKVTQVLVDGDKAYLSLSYYAGTGMFYNGGFVCEADLTKENSLQELEVETASYEDDEEMFQEVYLWMEDGELKTGYGIPFTAEYSGAYDGNGIRTYDEKGDPQLRYPDLVPAADTETFVSESLEKVCRIGDAYYFVRKRLFNDPSQAVGWREYYDTLYTEYDRMDADGTITVMREEPADLVMTGYLALGDSGEYVYFQPVDRYEDYEEVQMEKVSDKIAKVYPAEKNVVSGWNEFLEEDLQNRKPLSALAEYDLETYADADMEFSGYLGYYTGPEPISTQSFLLRFDGDGRLVQVAPDYAG